MPGSVRLVINGPAFNEYRNDPTVVALLQDLADGIGERLEQRADAFAAQHGVDPPPDGEHVSVTVTRGGTRARAYVRAKSVAARLAEAKDRALLQALGGG